MENKSKLLAIIPGVIGLVAVVFFFLNINYKVSMGMDGS